MVANIDVLADKIYREGVEKARNEAGEIIEKAKKKAEELVNEAHLTSEKIIRSAQEEALEIKQNAMSDVKLAGKKAIGALKQEIKKMLHQKVVSQPVQELFSDVNFLKELILTIAKNYSGDSATIYLPEKLKERLNDAIEGSIKRELENVKIDFSKSLKGGFQISRDNSDYLITFTDRDFTEFFKPFLNDKTEQLLFKNQE